MEGCVYYIRQYGWGSLECLICIQWHSAIIVVRCIAIESSFDGLVNKVGGLTGWMGVLIGYVERVC